MKAFWNRLPRPMPAGCLAASLTLVAAQLGFADTLPVSPYPDVGPTTHFLDAPTLLAGLPERGWFQANVPLVDLPDATIQSVYYYRWRVAHEAQKYTGAKNGWIVTEFLGPVFYSAPYGAISAAAGHHVAEARWIRDRRYLDDYLRYWLTGDGAGPKPAEDGVNKNTTDWAHEYSFWVGSATLGRAAVTGDLRFATGLLPQLKAFWEKWSPQYNPTLGLYWQTPVWDAMEYTASSYQSPDPYHGGDGYRPTLNAYQYGDAVAIASLAAVAGDVPTALLYGQRALSLEQAVERYLWDPTTSFYKHVMRDNNPGLAKIVDREESGFIPWMFYLARPDRATAWSQLLDPQGFAGDFGPTTVERRSRWFMFDASGCCHWDGPMWPYAASQTLTGLANLLIDYPTQRYVTKADYDEVLTNYAFAQQKAGHPYVAEAHDPDQPTWIYDSRGHSEDYNHSTFNDLVLSGLLGIRPQLDDSLVLHPLVPDAWDHFAVENLAYHGRNVTVLWDRDGSHYRQGSGLRVYVDGNIALTRPDLRPVRIPVPKPAVAPVFPALVNDAVNAFGGPTALAAYPVASASYTFPLDDPQRAIDGESFYLDVPNTRWTNYTSPNAQDWWSVDFGTNKTVSDVRIYFYDDGGGVRTPASYDLQYLTAAGVWESVPGVVRNPAIPVGNDLNRLTFPGLNTRALRVVLTPVPGAGVGITEFQSWRARTAADSKD